MEKSERGETHKLTLTVKPQDRSYDHLIRRVYQPEIKNIDLIDVKSLFETERTPRQPPEKNPFSFAPRPNDVIHYVIRLDETHDDGMLKYRLIFDGIYFFTDDRQAIAFPYLEKGVFKEIRTSKGFVKKRTSIRAEPNQNLDNIWLKLTCSEQIEESYYYTLRFEAINLTLRGPGYGATLGTLDIDPTVDPKPQKGN